MYRPSVFQTRSLPQVLKKYGALQAMHTVEPSSSGLRTRLEFVKTNGLGVEILHAVGLMNVMLQFFLAFDTIKCMALSIWQ